MAAAVIEGVLDKAESPDLALLAASAVFGGVRAPKEDPRFNAVVEAGLRRLQSVDRGAPSPLAKVGSYSTVKAMDAAKAKLEGDEEPDLSGMAADIGAALSGLAGHVAIQDDRLRGQINALAARQQSLIEQMDMQWWVANGYSRGTDAPFAKMPIGEAVVRAAFEMEELTLNDTGVRPGPALLDQVLVKVKHAGTALSLSQLAKAAPIAWRRDWAGALPDAPNAALTPVLHALRLSTEADDAEDWHARFERETRLNAQQKLSPLEWANQLYRERLATRLLG